VHSTEYGRWSRGVNRTKVRAGWKIEKKLLIAEFAENHRTDAEGG